MSDEDAIRAAKHLIGRAQRREQEAQERARREADGAREAIHRAIDESEGSEPRPTLRDHLSQRGHGTLPPASESPSVPQGPAELGVLPPSNPPLSIRQLSDKIGLDRLLCSACKREYYVGPNTFGTTVHCLHCGQKQTIPPHPQSSAQPSVSGGNDVDSIHKAAAMLAIASAFLYWVGVIPLVSAGVSLTALFSSKNQRQVRWSVVCLCVTGVFIFAYLVHYKHVKF